MINITAIHRAIIKFRRPKNIIILAYHRICELTGLFYDRNVSATPPEFRRQMEYVQKNYAAISIGRLIDYYEGKTDIPKNSIIITFDDGFKDTIENAQPVLKKLDLPATLFITTDFIKGDYLPWEDEMAYLVNRITMNNKLGDLNTMLKLNADVINKDNVTYMICRNLRSMTCQQKRFVLKQLYTIAGLSEKDVRPIVLTAKKGMMNDKDVITWLDSGLEIGSHTCSHPKLFNMDIAETEKELLSSKHTLEKICNKEIFAFAYPYGMKGYYDKNSIRCAQKARYKCAVSLRSGINSSKTNRFDLKRVGIAPYLSFEAACDGLIQY